MLLFVVVTLLQSGVVTVAPTSADAGHCESAPPRPVCVGRVQVVGDTAGTPARRQVSVVEGETEMESFSGGEGERLFLAMRNGANAGVLVRFAASCLAEAVSAAAAALGATELELGLGARLHTPMGTPFDKAGVAGVTTATVHVLLDQEVWVWPGRAVGHSWEHGGASFETLSIQPKVILVRGVLSPHECDALITEAGGKRRREKAHPSTVRGSCAGVVRGNTRRPSLC